MLWIGAALIIASVVLLMVQPLRRGQLSGGRLRSHEHVDTLEPRRPSVGFGLKESWLPLALFTVGAILMLLSAVFAI